MPEPDPKTFLPEAFFEAPIDCGLILGSGWGDVLRPETVHAEVPYADLPGYGASTVAGHAGKLLLMTLAGRRVAAFCGRRHWYEGCPMDQIVWPVDCLRRLGVRSLLLTNAAGGLNPDFAPGTLMVLTDHINLSGISPLRGPLREGWGPRFPDMSAVYDPDYADLLAAAGGPATRRGVYAFSVGPAYETPAEIRAWRLLGADAVGMSTVPEAIAASHMGLRTLGISCLTNMAAGILDQKLNHEEVLETGERVKGAFTALVREIVRTWK